MLEFGPLWMVALWGFRRALRPAMGWLMAALWADARRPFLDAPLTVAVIAATIVACCVVLIMSDVIGIVIVAQILLVLLMVAVSIPITGRLHDAVPSTIRAGVALWTGRHVADIFPCGVRVRVRERLIGNRRRRLDDSRRGAAHRRAPGLDRPGTMRLRAYR